MTSRYHPDMIRAVMAFWAAMAVALAGVAIPGVASAEPWPPAPCGFSISPPQVVDVGGVAKVTATVTTGRCGFAASPYKTVACVELAGQQRSSCMQGTDTAQAFFEPYTPGATYISRGRGCGIIIPTLPADNCQILGPNQATL